MFYAYQNNFSGTFFPEISKWTKLVSLQIYQNAFSGTFPSSIGACTALTTLVANDNQFSGLPQELLTLPLLTTVNFQGNYLTAIPNFANYSNKANLTLKLKDNLIDFLSWESVFGASGAHGIKILEYVSQRVFAAGKIHEPAQGTLTITAAPRGSYGAVTWEKKSGSTWTGINGSNEDATQQTLKLSAATAAINGIYRWTVTNTRVTSLTLQSGEYEVTVVDAAPQTLMPANYNGLISSVYWRTDEAYQTGEGELKGIYRFQYDAKCQVLDSRWGTPNAGWNGFEDKAIRTGLPGWTTTPTEISNSCGVTMGRRFSPMILPMRTKPTRTSSRR